MRASAGLPALVETGPCCKHPDFFRVAGSLTGRRRQPHRASVHEASGGGAPLVPQSCSLNTRRVMRPTGDGASPRESERNFPMRLQHRSLGTLGLAIAALALMSAHDAGARSAIPAGVPQTITYHFNSHPMIAGTVV